ncbi:MAG: alr [Haloplasmataceae bacterium]|jgi:alanine racemase|nr:alr [Haloplasmataceae bacterium]
MNGFSETYITLKRENLILNTIYFKKISNKKIIGVIKSNAYGHGIYEVANTLKNYCDAFAVASLDEAIFLRDMNINIPILVFNEVSPQFISFAVSYNLMITVSSLNYLYQIYGSIPEDKKLLIQLKIDTGMNRMGIKGIDDYIKIIEYLKDIPKMNLKGIYSHFHTPNNEELSKKQVENFINILKSVDYEYEYIHIASSNAVIHHLDIPETNYIRIGLGLYGLCDDEFQKPVLALYSRINLIKEVKKGEIVGYNAQFKAEEDCIVGIVPVGYSDGILRANMNRKVFVDGYYCEIIGSICMNALMIKLPKKDIKKEVELIGPHINAIEIASHLKTIPYEVVTCLIKDLKRVII